MARDRKRAKQRRERQARAAGAQRRTVERPPAPPHEHPSHEHEPPEVASGEVDLAEAHLALGRPELANELSDPVPATTDDDAVEDGAGAPELADEAEFEQLEDRVDAAEERFERGRNGGGEAGTEVVERAERAPRATAPRDEGNRFANFLRGSWRELERVQWPDRRQVAQATAVVIGFVIVAGAFLGVMDFFASKIVELIV